MATTTNTLRLEVGKKYKTRDGEEVLIDDFDADPMNPYPFTGVHDDTRLTWKPDGTFFGSRPSDEDLVSEIPDEAPAYRYFRYSDPARNLGGQDMRWRVAPGARPEACDRHEGVWRESAHCDPESLMNDPGLVECNADGNPLEPEPADHDDLAVVSFKTTEDLTSAQRTRIAKLAARIVLADGPVLTVDELAGMTIGELVGQLKRILETEHCLYL